MTATPSGGAAGTPTAISTATGGTGGTGGTDGTGGTGSGGTTAINEGYNGDNMGTGQFVSYMIIEENLNPF